MLLLASLAVLAGCSGSVDPAAPQGNGAAAPPPDQPDNRIECRPAGAASFARTCTVDSADSPQGWVLTIRKADGGFRRLLVGRDGRISAADGAEPAHILSDDAAGTDVEIGGDRFRLPRRAR
jgi:hypothetical protein